METKVVLRPCVLECKGWVGERGRVCRIEPHAGTQKRTSVP